MNKKIHVFTGLLFCSCLAINTAMATDNKNEKKNEAPTDEQKQTENTKSDPQKGEVLFKKAKCLSCHGTDIFTREDRKVSDLVHLEKQVRICDSQHDGNWYEPDIRDVVSYLNKAYYHFPDAKKPKDKQVHTDEKITNTKE